ncbi:MAG: polysaccharide biosynthesis protein [Candidatus Azobacteroides sp.]|nr:polysaccharide biosynthesis protein [Candidatus Azobacteroides sp.]
MLKNLQHRIVDKYLSIIFTKLQKLPYLPKRMVFAMDMFIAAASFFVSYYIRYAFLADGSAFRFFYINLLLYIATAGFFFFAFNTYSEFVRFSSFRNIMRIFLALFCANAFLLLAFRLMPHAFHYSVYTKVGFIISFLLSSCSIFLFRMLVRILYDYMFGAFVKKKKTPMLIYGTDSVQIGIAKMIRANEYLPYTVAGFISPNRQTQHHRIVGCRVYSLEEVFNKLVPFRGIKTVLLRTEELQPEEKKTLLRHFSEHKIELLSAPSIENLSNVRKIRKINIEDLLQRNPIKIETESIAQNLKGKTVLITGAAGSIGSEIAKQLCQFDLGLLLLCDTAESPLHQLYLEISEKHALVKFIPIVADVRNKERMKGIFEKYKPQIIYHAAAYKHVPLMELYPSEAVFTNVFGTKVIADLAVAYQAECFVMISTDKAVNPSNVMGASKRIAEIYIHSLSTFLKKSRPSDLQPRFITTRFGNVLGSNGSVVPLFTKQIAEGGPVTVTDAEIIRYFMTIPEACSLVLEAGNFGKGGEVFVFDMGEPVKIKDMAEEMIRLSGFEPYKDIDIVYTGLRPGEKLHEELLYDKEVTKSTYNEKIMIGSVREYDYVQVTGCLDRLRHIANHYNEKEIVRIMKKIVPEYISQNSEFEILDKEARVRPLESLNC